MTGPIVFACILLFFVLILSIRAKIILEYETEVKLTVKLLGLIKIPILPKKEKKSGPHSMSPKQAERLRRKLEKKQAKKAAKKKKKQEEKEAKKLEKQQVQAKGVKEKSKLNMTDILDLIDLATAVVKALLGTFFKHLRVRVARLRVTVATGDAATTAVAYGAVTQAIPVLYPYLEQIPTFRFPDVADIDVSIDYLKESPEIDLRMEFTLRVWHVFAVLFRTLGKLIGRGFRFLWNRAKRQDQKANSAPSHKHRARKKKKANRNGKQIK